MYYVFVCNVPRYRAAKNGAVRAISERHGVFREYGDTRLGRASDVSTSMGLPYSKDRRQASEFSSVQFSSVQTGFLLFFVWPLAATGTCSCQAARIKSLTCTTHATTQQQQHHHQPPSADSRPEAMPRSSRRWSFSSSGSSCMSPDCSRREPGAVLCICMMCWQHA